jgi:acyl-CoA synthetase (AMP-forming)/AMP-acid ligase II
MTAPSTVGAMLKARARLHPERHAIRVADGEGWANLTYAELDGRSDRIAVGLGARGVKKGDRVLVLVKPGFDLYAVLYALMKMGAVPVLVDPGMGLRNVLACVAQIQPRVVIAIPAVHVARRIFRRPFRSAELFVTVGGRWGGGVPLDAVTAPPGTAFELPDLQPDDEVGIVFTSGSTGTPKGVTYTHRVFHAVALLADARIGRVEGAVYLEAFAAYVLFDVAQGMTSVLPAVDLSKPAKADPKEVLRAIQENGCTGMFASPAILRSLFRHCAATGTELPQLSTVLTGVAPIPADLHRGLRAANPSATMHVVYGATEGMTVAHTDSDEVLGETWERTGRGDGFCVGRPFDGTEVRIAAVTKDPIPTFADARLLPAGEIGEILISGAVVSPEYKDRPDANRLSKIPDGPRFWHRTGDVGFVGPSGRLWYGGRVAHVVETADGPLPSVCVEGVFNEQPGVRRTALVGVGDPGREVPLLLVELEGDVAWSDELRAAVLARARGTRWEGRVAHAEPHPGFPVDARHNSKIRREDLRAFAARKYGRLAASVAAR